MKYQLQRKIGDLSWRAWADYDIYEEAQSSLRHKRICSKNASWRIVWLGPPAFDSIEESTPPPTTTVFNIERDRTRWRICYNGSESLTHTLRRLEQYQNDEPDVIFRIVQVTRI